MRGGPKNPGVMQRRHSRVAQPFDDQRLEESETLSAGTYVSDLKLLGEEVERRARARLFEEVLAGVELVLRADGAALWRADGDASLVLTASRSMPPALLQALDKQAVSALQSIMLRWPDSPLVAIPLEDRTDPIAEELRVVAEKEGIVGLAGVPCRTPGEMLGLFVVVHRRPHTWTIRDLGLATGFAGQLATAMQNARLYASVRSLASRLTAIHELSLHLAQLRDVDTITEAIVAQVGRLVDCDAVRVYRPDGPEGRYRIVASFGLPGSASAPGPRLPNGETLPSWVARRNEPLVIPDSSVERGSIQRLSPGPESVLLVPMAYGDEVLGVLVVSRAGANRYGPEDEQALSIFGRQAGQALVNARNIACLESQQAILEQQLSGERRLLDVSETLVSTLDPRQVLEQIADTIGSVVHYDWLTIYRQDRTSGGIEPVVTRLGGDVPDPEADACHLDEGLTSWVIGRGDPVCANGVADEVLARALENGLEQGGAAADETPGGSRSMIVVPLRVHGEVVGSLNLTRFGGREAHFAAPEFELCKLFAGQASIALQNAETHLTVATRADLDSLTGLRNHGTFQRDLDALVETAEPFSLLMMDLDSFKAYNDTYGHPAGDALLKTVADAVVGATRQDDRAYRYGGDEFALLLRGAGSTHASEVARRIRAAVKEAVAAAHPGAAGVRFGITVGAARWPGDAASKAELVSAADDALYAAKGHRAETPQGMDDSPVSCSVLLLEAAADLVKAAGHAEVAQAVVRHAAAIASTADAMVALLPPAAAFQSEPVMEQTAGRGLFSGTCVQVHYGEGLWGRVWAENETLSQDDGARRLTGWPILAGGSVAGILALALPAAGISTEAGRSLDHLAGLAGAALTRAIASTHQSTSRAR
jgi:diguanylate cyclase (GGDEF)-like protein